MNFSPFLMAQFNAKWQAGSLQNWHSSNPQPFDWHELEALTKTDLARYLKKTPLTYEPMQGDETLRSLLIQHYHSTQTVQTAQNVMLTSGAQEAIFLVMNALLSNGDHAITFSPCFEPLVTVAQNTGADVTTLPLQAEKAWSIDWPQLEASFRNNTRVLIINFPHNPTGSHIKKSELLRLLDLCDKHNCWLFSDEVFRGLEHDSQFRLPVASDLYDKAIAMGVMSKALALPGIRLGWLSTQNVNVLQKMITIKSHLSICQSSLDTQVCQAIIPHSELIWQRNLAIITKNKKHIEDGIVNHPSFHWQAPKASATGFIQLKHQSALTFTIKVADKKKILLMPNEMFLCDHQGFRISLGIHSATFDIAKLINP